jgi:hypothetical protein
LTAIENTQASPRNSCRKLTVYPPHSKPMGVPLNWECGNQGPE